MAVKDTNTTVATIISKAEKEELNALAKDNGRSLSNLIAHIIRQYLSQKKA